MEWKKIAPLCFEQYKDDNKYMVIVYRLSDCHHTCSYDLIFWHHECDYWTNSYGYPSWGSNELYEDYTHYIVIEKPVTQ